MNRLYSVESTPTTTGMKAEHRLGLRASEVPAFAAALAAAGRCVRCTARLSTHGPASSRSSSPPSPRTSKASAGKSAVIPGLYQDESVAALALAINQALGNVGKTVAVSSEPCNSDAQRSDRRSRRVSSPISMPARSTGSSFSMRTPSTRRPPTSVSTKASRQGKDRRASGLALRRNRADLAHWHIPAAHYLESWSDARAYDGTVSIVQPMIEPLYGGVTAHDVLQTLLDNPRSQRLRSRPRPPRKTTSRATSKLAGAKRFTPAGSRTPRSNAAGWRSERGDSQMSPRPTPKDQLEIIFRPDPNIYDGRCSNVGWLQELPKPVTNLSWDNAAIISGSTREKLNARRRRHRRDQRWRRYGQGAGHRCSRSS